MFKHACALGCEGIVSKRTGSRYRSGRSREWLKFKTPLRQLCVARRWKTGGGTARDELRYLVWGAARIIETPG